MAHCLITVIQAALWYIKETDDDVFSGKLMIKTGFSLPARQNQLAAAKWSEFAL